MLIKACLNGSRVLADHPALPLTPSQLAEAAAQAVAAGAGALHSARTARPQRASSSVLRLVYCVGSISALDVTTAHEVDDCDIWR